MSVKKISKEQPKSFEFSKENFIQAENILKIYPKNKKSSAVMPLLYLAQSQNNNWIPMAAIKYIAKYLGMSHINVFEVATFYTMYNLSPVGKYHVQVCTTTPCMIRGADKIVEICKKNISDKQNEISKDNICSWTEVECLGACVNGPMMQINKDYYEDLDKENADKIIKMLFEDKFPKPGSYRGRKNTSPEKTRNTLLGSKHA